MDDKLATIFNEAFDELYEIYADLNDLENMELLHCRKIMLERANKAMEGFSIIAKHYAI